MNLKELREKLGKLSASIRRMADEHNAIEARGEKLPAEQSSAWTKLNAEYDATKTQLERALRAEQVEKELAAPAPRAETPGKERYDGDEGRTGRAEIEEKRARAINAWARTQLGGTITEEDEEACVAAGIRPEQRNLDLQLLPTQELRKLQRLCRDVHPTRFEERALSAIALNLGAITVPETLVRSLETNMLAFGGILQAAEIIRTASGEKITWPTADDTSNSGEQIGESTAVAEADTTFGAVTWDAYKFSSKGLKVPYELLEDAAFDFVSWIGAALGERLGRIQATKATTGNGAGTMKGIVTASSLGVTAASASSVAPDELMDLVHSVNPAYRNGPGVGFMLNDATVLHLRKKKDGNGQYLWQPGMQAGVPDRLIGYPVIISQEMSSIATGVKSILFGQLSKYKVRQVNSIRLYRLVERHRESDQDAFIAFLRADGNLLDAGTAPVKHLIQA